MLCRGTKINKFTASEGNRSFYLQVAEVTEAFRVVKIDCQSFYLRMPRLLFALLKKKRNNWSRSYNFVFALNASPFSKLSDKVGSVLLPNIYSTGKICMDFKGEDVIDVIDCFWNSKFSFSCSDDAESWNNWDHLSGAVELRKTLSHQGCGLGLYKLAETNKTLLRTTDKKDKSL